MISFHPGYFGWLGNQMFQYAATFGLAKRVGTEAGFPQNDPNLFEIFNLTATKDGLAPFLLEEVAFHYIPLPTTHKDLLLRGYFQSEKYFEDCKEEIKKEFSFKYPVDDKIDPYTTSIHVRRGDYVDLPEYHPLCTIDYYEKGMSLSPDQKFLVFSDDIDWCKNNLKGDEILYSEGHTPEEDLQLMTMCDNHIIANSSFSWWGAWLGHNKKKRVFAPRKWVGVKYSHMSDADRIPSNWEIL